MSTSAPKKRSAPSLAVANVLRVYLRQSIGEDRNTHGITAQRGVCERAAVEQALPWASRAEYIDQGYSRDDAKRPEFLRLLSETEPGDTILIWERSRLGVDLAYLVAVHRLAKECGARIVVASGDPVDASETGLVMEHVRTNADGNELRRIRGRTREKLRERVLKGYVAGPLPYGLESYPENPADPSSWKLGRKVPAEEAVIVRVARMYIDGAGWDRIAHTLNAEGVRAPSGGEWTRSHVWDLLLRQSVYQDGLYAFGRRGGKGGRIPPVTYSHPDWIMGTPDLWSAVHATHAARTTDMRAIMANGAKHTLSGVGRCVCGGSLQVQKDGRAGKVVVDYQCSAHRRKRGCTINYRVRASLLEDAIRDALTPWFDAAKVAIRQAAREAEEALASAAAPDVAGIERELTQARAEQARLVKLAVATGGEVDAVAEALREGQAQVKRLEAAHTRATAPRADASALAHQIETRAVQRLDALREALHGADARDALKALFPQGLRVRLMEDTVEVEAEGVVVQDVRDMVRQPDDCRTEYRTPFRVSFSRKAA